MPDHRFLIAQQLDLGQLQILLCVLDGDVIDCAHGHR